MLPLSPPSFTDGADCMLPAGLPPITSPSNFAHLPPCPASTFPTPPASLARCTLLTPTRPPALPLLPTCLLGPLHLLHGSVVREVEGHEGGEVAAGWHRVHHALLVFQCLRLGGRGCGRCVWMGGPRTIVMGEWGSGRETAGEAAWVGRGVRHAADQLTISEVRGQRQPA